MDDLRNKVSAAVKQFWETRSGQAKEASGEGGGRDAVVGGAQMDGFVDLISELLIEAGLPDATVHRKSRNLTLPGFFRPTKNWDLLVVVDDSLLASIEFKSQVGSFGNNYNNRTEEALGNATDLWTAYREGAFRDSPRPWLGWLMLLEDSPESNSSVKVSEPFFKIFEEFRGASYAKRYELLCKKIIRERLYDGACLILSDKEGGLNGDYREPLREIDFQTFAASLLGKAEGYAKLRGSK